jgi:hypothetical protein
MDSSVKQLATRVEVVAVAVSMLCAGATQIAVPSPTRSVALAVAPMAAIVQSPTSIGVADASLYFDSPADVDKTLDTLQSLGVQNVRIDIPWAGVQKWDSTSYDWTAVDQVVNAAAARNMGVLGVLNATPIWAGSPYLSGAPNPQAYATFASAVANRYGAKISAYEIWNEPNASNFFNPVDPTAYTRLLQAAYPAIKAANPSAMVIGGVVGSVGTFGGLTMTPEAFIAGMYSAGAKGSFDALSFHPYQYFLPFSAGAQQAESPLNQLDAIRQLMVANGDVALKIWATEYGEPTSVVTEQQQAAYIKDFLTTWQAQAGAGPIFLDTTRDSASALYVDDSLGLYYDNWTPKLAVQTIKNFIAGIGDSTPPAMAAEAFTAFAAVVSQATGIPLPAVALVVGLVRTVVDAVNAVIQGIATLAQRVTDAIVAPLARLAAAPQTTAARSAIAVQADLQNTTVAEVGVPAAAKISTVAPVADTKVSSAVTTPAAAAPSSTSQPTVSLGPTDSPNVPVPLDTSTTSRTSPGLASSSSSLSDDPAPAHPREPRPSLQGATGDDPSRRNDRLSTANGSETTADAANAVEKHDPREQAAAPSESPGAPRRDAFPSTRHGNGEHRFRSGSGAADDAAGGESANTNADAPGSRGTVDRAPGNDGEH